VEVTGATLTGAKSGGGGSGNADGNGGRGCAFEARSASKRRVISARVAQRGTDSAVSSAVKSGCKVSECQEKETREKRLTSTSSSRKRRTGRR
jgi:hypothetical protein